MLKYLVSNANAERDQVSGIGCSWKVAVAVHLLATSDDSHLATKVRDFAFGVVRGGGKHEEAGDGGGNSEGWTASDLKRKLPI